MYYTSSITSIYSSTVYQMTPYTHTALMVAVLVIQRNVLKGEGGGGEGCRVSLSNILELNLMS